MKIGIVGAGNWGLNLIRNFCKILGIENVVVCDTNRDRLLGLKSEYPGIENTENFQNILSSDEIEAIVIATPAETHYELSKKALLSGKHVFVEKPITLDVDEAEELIKISNENHLTLMVDHILEYHPVICEMKKLIETKALGEIYYIYSQRLNLGIIRSHENALWSLGPHDGGVYIQNKKTIEDTVFLHLHFLSGVDAHAHLSWLDPHKIRRLTVVGSEKMAVFDDMEPRNKLIIFDKGAEWTEKGGVGVRYGDIRIPNIPMKEPLMLACKHFLECIEKDKIPRSDGNDGLRVLKILKKAQKSLEEKKVI
jgi:predicted dehydrogenase